MANLHSSISFGLVNIPIVMNPIVKNNDTSFNQLHYKCGHRISYVKYCSYCKKEVKEKDIISWCNSNELKFINCACKFTEMCSLENEGISKRKEIKELIENLRKVNSNVDYNIFKSLDNINLNCVLGTKKDGIYKSFLDDYEEN